MKTSEKPYQKSYRTGGSLYFTAGLLFSMVLIVTAFEWKSTYKILENDIELTKKKDTELPDFIFKNLPSKPTPPPSPGAEIKTVPDPIVKDPIDLVPPVPIDPTPTPDGADTPPAGLFNGPPVDLIPVEVLPSKAAVPAAGYDAFYQYLYKHLRVPQHLINQNIDGKVYVSFVIDTDGTLTDFEILKGFDQSLENQIIKILKNAPAWEPAMHEGKKVRARMQLPVVIKITR